LGDDYSYHHGLNELDSHFVSVLCHSFSEPGYAAININKVKALLSLGFAEPDQLPLSGSAQHAV
jgi:hypothetical protein